jgi:hypothetical protein
VSGRHHPLILRAVPARRGAGAWPAVLAGLCLACAAPLAAQAEDTVPAPEPPAAPAPVAPVSPSRLPVSPLLPVTHWASEAVVRAQDLGLLRGWVRAQRAVPREAVRAALDEAAASAAERNDPRLSAMVDGWRRRFAEEFRLSAPVGAVRLRSLGGSAVGGYDDWTGRMEPASGSFGSRRDPRVLPDRSQAAGSLSVAAGMGTHLAVLAEGDAGDAVDLGRWEVAAGWHKWTLAAGRMPVGYGTARSGAIVITDTDLERLELRTESPLRLPGFLRYLGPVAGHLSITRLDEARHPGDPYFLTTRAAFQPHPRFTVGLNRAAVFGGDSISTPVTLRNVAQMFVGGVSTEFENQVVSVDARFRLPTETILPLVVYMDWGAEDSSGAWWKVPGRVLGVTVPAVPGVPELALGVEHTGFRESCCGNPQWYFHGSHHGDWVVAGRPLGHPLGGEGAEVMGYGVASLWDARVRVEGRAFHRDRRQRDLALAQRAGNLYSPERTGRSRGGSLDAAWRLAPRSDLRASFFRDAGRDWTEQRLTASLSFFF